MNLIIDQGQLRIELKMTEKIYSCRRGLVVPVEKIIKIKRGLPEHRFLQMRAPGTYIPGLIKAGTFWTRAGKEFWLVRSEHTEYVTIDLSNGLSFRRLVLGLDEEKVTVLQELENRVKVPFQV